MKKFFKWFGISLLILVVVLFAAFKFMQYNTKKSSPEKTTEYKQNGLELVVFYCQPSKKGRDIFGDLVPYGKVWRTGANEATTFETNKDLKIDGKTLPAGKYTLWTIPNKDQWAVIFNKKQYGWGVNWDNEVTREPEADVLQVNTSASTLPGSQEVFTISFSESPVLSLDFVWDQTKVSLPLRQ